MLIEEKIVWNLNGERAFKTKDEGINAGLYVIYFYLKDPASSPVERHKVCALQGKKSTCRVFAGWLATNTDENEGNKSTGCCVLQEGNVFSGKGLCCSKKAG